ncbi:MAG: T9SS type A sorting domain-containing protein [Bacteroidetes bacterium]|nr:T9SS type A sorting domain-containing protein [Bacteroidota bacterium]
MKKLVLTLVALSSLALGAYAQYPVKSVYETQFRSEADLLAKKDLSPLIATQDSYSDTISIVAVVLEAPYQADGKRTYYSSSSPTIVRFNVADTTFLRTRDFAWNCINVATDLDSSFTPKDPLKLGQLEPGMIVKLTGRVREFLKSTQFELLKGRKEGGVTVYTNIVEVIDQVDLSEYPKTISLPIATFNVGTWVNNVTTTQQLVTGEPYESAPVSLTNVTVTGLIKNNGEAEIFIQDGSNNVFAVDNQANRFRSDQGLWPSGKPIAPVNARLDSIQGYISTYNSNGMYGINPINSDWVFVAPNMPPTISTWTKSRKYYAPNEATTITFSVGDNDGTLTKVAMNYRTSISDDFTEVLAVKGTGNDYSAIIPAVTEDSAFVEFYLTATDNGNSTTRQPTVDNYAFWVLTDAPSIGTIQFSRRSDTESLFKGDTLTVEGVVTSTRRLIGDVYLQNGTGPWSGIQIFGARTDSFEVGDLVRVTGTVDEFSGKTQIRYFTTADFTVLDRGVPLPAATPVASSDIMNGGSLSEAFESVLVSLANVYVINTNSNIATDGKSRGEILVSENESAISGLTIDDKANRNNHILPFINTLNVDYTLTKADSLKDLFTLGQKFETLSGIVDAFFLSYSLQPRDSADFGFNSGISVRDENPGAFELSQNYPNPFNPSTTIRFRVPVTSTVTIEVFNLLGQRVTTLVNKQIAANTNQVVTFNGAGLSSGLYFYQLKADNRVMATRKMMMIK